MNKKFLLVLLGFLVLIVLVFFLCKCFLIKKEISNQNTENIILENNVVSLESLTLKQKIAQMIMVRGDKKDLKFNNLNVGGIFLDRQDSSKGYQELIQSYQDSAKIKLLVATDLEGAWTPFHNPTPSQIFPYFSDINTSEQAYEVGLAHGQELKNIGFNLNFAPIAEFSDIAYGGRVFLGSEQEVKEKIKNYIRGLNQNALGTCKHYPGKALQKNLHDVSDTQTIGKKDLELFQVCVDNNISSIMVSHQIVNGEIDSQKLPSSVSKEVISTLDDFNGLIIADEINMKGLTDFYPKKIDMYVDLINSGEQLILDFYLNPKEVYLLIERIEEKVQEGVILEEDIDKAVKRILETKGYLVA